MNTGSTIFATRGPGVSTLVKQMTGNGTSFSPTRSLTRSPSPSPQRGSKADQQLYNPPDSPPRSPTINGRAVGGTIAKLTQQLTGNGLVFLSGGSRPPIIEGISVLMTIVLLFLNFNIAIRASSPEMVVLDTVTEEDAPAGSRQTTSVHGSNKLLHQRSFLFLGSSWAISRQMTGGSLSPTRQLNSGSVSPTRTAFLRRPKSLLGSRHGHHRSLDEREGRGMFLVKQMTGTDAN